MVKLFNGGVIYKNGKLEEAPLSQKVNNVGSIAYGVLKAHNIGTPENLNIKFDEITSHDITYVGIIQTAKASGLKSFPLPYTLTNCHNSLCAVGGTINEDDHVFGLSAAKKYGGAFVPPHIAVIHQYMREMRAFSGGMILGSDSHTRYGALGTLAVGEGGPELVKQLLGRTYDLQMPEIVVVNLSQKANALRIFPFGRRKAAFPCLLPHLALQHIANRKHELAYLHVVYLSEKVSLVFDMVLCRRKIDFVVYKRSSAVMTGGNLVKAVSPLLFKAAKLD